VCQLLESIAQHRNTLESLLPAVRLLQQAREYVPGSSAPATRSWLSAREAEELARLGDETGALRAVERALTAFDFSRPWSERPWTAFFGASRFGSMTVSAYTTLHHREATAAADSLLTSLSPMENKVRAIVLSDLTINAAQTNDYDQATVLVSEAVELTTRTETTLARQRLLALAATLPRRTTKALPASCVTRSCQLSAGSALRCSGRSSLVGNPRQVLVTSADNR
jgi:hypothetical protein